MSDSVSVEKMIDAIAEYAKLTGQGSNSSSTINVNMGGYGVLIAVSCAVISLVVLLCNGRDIATMQADMIDKANVARAERAALRESLDTQQAYLNVLLQNSKTKESK